MDGKGFLLNEPGIQPTSVYDLSCKEEAEVDSPGGEEPWIHGRGGRALGTGSRDCRGPSLLAALAWGAHQSSSELLNPGVSLKGVWS